MRWFPVPSVILIFYLPLVKSRKLISTLKKEKEFLLEIKSNEIIKELELENVRQEVSSMNNQQKRELDQLDNVKKETIDQQEQLTTSSLIKPAFE